MSNHTLENLNLKLKELGDKTAKLAGSVKDDLKIGVDETKVKLNDLKAKIEDHQKKLDSKAGEKIDSTVLDQLNAQYEELSKELETLTASLKK